MSAPERLPYFLLFSVFVCLCVCVSIISKYPMEILGTMYFLWRKVKWFRAAITEEMTVKKKDPCLLHYMYMAGFYNNVCGNGEKERQKCLHQNQSFVLHIRDQILHSLSLYGRLIAFQ